MTIDLTKLNRLKDITLTAKDLQKPMTYFYDHFADHREFINISKPTEDEFLDHIILSLGKRLFKKKKIVIQQKLFLTVDGYDFIHGPVIMEGKMMSFAYFPDIQIGVFSIHMGNETLFGRMTATELDSGTKGPVFMMPPDRSIN